jgi:hypothetical protein
MKPRRVSMHSPARVRPRALLVLFTAGLLVRGAGFWSTAEAVAQEVWRSDQADMRIDGQALDLVAIGQLVVFPDRRVALTQPINGTVRFFDPNGTPLGEVGRRGQGPGEFASFVRAGSIGDTLWIFDGRNDRFTLIDEKLDVVATHPGIGIARADSLADATIPSFGLIIPVTRFADGSVIARPGVALSRPPGYDESMRYLALVRRDGFMTEVIASFRATPGFFFRGDRGMNAGADFPFSAQPAYAVSPSGTWVAVVMPPVGSGAPAELEVSWWNRSEGETKRAVPFTAVRLPRRVAFDALERTARGMPPAAAKAFRKEARKEALLTKIYPPVRSAVISDDGTLWIRLRSGPQSWHYRVVEASGATSVVEFPDGDEVKVVGRDDVWTIQKDEWDVESVLRYPNSTFHRDR